jgi:CheY-like chemotaxis protein
MPTSDGMDLLKRIRGNEIYRNIPFIMLAAKEEAKVSENKITVQSVKPFNANHLKSCVERFVSIK